MPSLKNIFTPSFVSSPYVLLTLCIVGSLLRLWVLGARGPLWLDEAHLASTMLNRNWEQMFLPLGNNQVAPLGFLLAAKFFTSFIQNIEVALRLPSFIAGLAVIPAAWWLCKKQNATPAATNFLMMIVCLFPPFIQYSAEFKHYSAEILFAFIILACFIQFHRTPSSRNLFILIIAGYFCAAFTIAAPFILLFPGIATTLYFLRRRSWTTAIVTSLACLGWAILYFYLLHIVTPTDSATASAMQDTLWKGQMMPHNPMKVPRWIIEQSIMIFESFGFGRSAILALLAFTFALPRSYKTDRTLTLAMLSPIALIFLASAFGQYPVAERLVLFTAAGVLPIAITGINGIGNTFAAIPYARLVWVVLLLFFPLNSLPGKVLRKAPFTSDELPRVLTYIKDNHRAGDMVYVSSYALPSLRVYEKNLGMARENIILGHDPRATVGNEFDPHNSTNFEWFMNDIGELSQRSRIWLVVARTGDPQAQVLRQTMLYFCRTQGVIADQYETAGAAAYLCEFSNHSPAWKLETAPPAPYRPVHNSYILELP